MSSIPASPSSSAPVSRSGTGTMPGSKSAGSVGGAMRGCVLEEEAGPPMSCADLDAAAVIAGLRGCSGGGGAPSAKGACASSHRGPGERSGNASTQSTPAMRSRGMRSAAVPTAPPAAKQQPQPQTARSSSSGASSAPVPRGTGTPLQSLRGTRDKQQASAGAVPLKQTTAAPKTKRGSGSIVTGAAGPSPGLRATGAPAQQSTPPTSTRSSLKQNQVRHHRVAAGA